MHRGGNPICASPHWAGEEYAPLSWTELAEFFPWASSFGVFSAILDDALEKHSAFCSGHESGRHAFAGATSGLAQMDYPLDKFGPTTRRGGFLYLWKNFRHPADYML
jgi:hypothetical protein